MCRLDTRWDSARELVKQQVTAEVLDLRRQQSFANDASSEPCFAFVPFAPPMNARILRDPSQLPADCRAPGAVGLPACLHSPTNCL